METRTGACRSGRRFAYGSARVKAWFEERGQLATERPLLDDNGDGIGREAEIELPARRHADTGARAPTGHCPRRPTCSPDPPIPATADAELGELLTRRAELESRLDLLRAAKGTMPQDEYDAQLERSLLEMARIDRQIRGASSRRSAVVRRKSVSADLSPDQTSVQIRDLHRPISDRSIPLAVVSS